ncbi:MAG: 16S rRNA (guanine(527)-N(7))-methyltransferase RsmG [Candidatus Pacebacteria bacterium]|nr:16S rRNA (guanine(527)-N(7))-methyltransferase RsmG [Candidatus Paceibacterota bacterium]
MSPEILAGKQSLTDSETMFHEKHLFAEKFPLPPAAMARMEAFVAHLLYWQDHKNLIAPSTIPHIWHRHILDSAQLYSLLPQNLTDPSSTAAVIDLGSGAGFPGLVLAIMGVKNIHLVESQRAKARFLSEVNDKLSLGCRIYPERIEQLKKPVCGKLPIGAITARALAPLDQLLGLCADFAPANSPAFFAKGRSWPDEMARAQKLWKIKYQIHPSITDADSAIIEITEFQLRK